MAGTTGASTEDGNGRHDRGSIHPQAVGWWVLAALAALVGLAVVGQALARQSAVESEDHPTLVAVGMSGRSSSPSTWHGTWWWAWPAPSAPS